MSYWDTPERVAFGLWAEQHLKSRLEAEMGMKLFKTKETYDLVDFESEDGKVVVELKARRKYDCHGGYQTPHRFFSWLFPTCKEPALKRAKKAVLFYYWVFDDSLWRLDYDASWAAVTEREVPEWHRSYAEHWYIPASLWRHCPLPKPVPSCPCAEAG